MEPHTEMVCEAWCLHEGDEIHSTVQGWQRVDAITLILVIDIVGGTTTPRVLCDLTVGTDRQIIDPLSRFTTRRA